MVWIALIFLFTCLLLWALFGPVILCLDTEANRYHLALPGIFKAAVIPTEELFCIRGWIFFIPYKLDPLKVRKGKERPRVAKPEKRSVRKTMGEGIRTVPGLVGAFRIRKFYLDLDTDDFTLNAWLVPLFSFANSDRIRMRVNFEGYSSLTLDIRTRLGSLLWIFMKTKYKSFFNL